ncbi:MAG: hypothetical protein ACI9JN_000629 [Bacteroidia bacterium]|jgi:uncharacterized protein YndB with AHSA1/START domain
MKLTIDADGNAVTISQKFSRDLQIVWNAFTDSMLLDQWWAPMPWKAVTKEMNFEEGGSWDYNLVSPNGEEFSARMDFNEIKIFKSISAMDVFTDDEGLADKEMPASHWNLFFETLGNGTLVTEKIIFEDAYHLNSTLEMGFEQGLKESFRLLERLMMADQRFDNSNIE